MAEKRYVYFIMETVRAEDGGYIPCIATEGEGGYHETDWNWGRDKEIAQELCDKRNERMGIEPREAMRIQLRTMALPFISHNLST